MQAKIVCIGQFCAKTGAMNLSVKYAGIVPVYIIYMTVVISAQGEQCVSSIPVNTKASLVPRPSVNPPSAFTEGLGTRLYKGLTLCLLLEM